MKDLISKGLGLLIVVLGLSSAARAQYAWDVGLHLGGANYLGEMGGKEKPRRDFIWDLKLNQTRWCFGGFARRKFNRMISANFGVLYMRIQGADAWSENPARVGRNLNFRNDMVEAYLRGEFTLYQDNDVGGKGKYKKDFRLFGYAGVAAFHHKPKGQINREGSFFALQDFTTELESYSNIGMAIPVGVGMHYTFKRRHRVGVDLGWRTTFTDYLDDVSTVYKDPDLLPDGAEAWYDQRPYLGTTDLDAGTPGQQVENANGDLVTIPGLLQYGWQPSEGPSVQKPNKRGDPTHNDSYLTMTFTYSFVLKGQSNFYRQRYSWMRGKKRVGRKSRAKF